MFLGISFRFQGSDRKHAGQPFWSMSKKRREISSSKRKETESNPLRESEVKKILGVRRHTESIGSSIPGGFYALLQSCGELTCPCLKSLIYPCNFLKSLPLKKSVLAIPGSCSRMLHIKYYDTVKMRNLSSVQTTRKDPSLQKHTSRCNYAEKIHSL